MREERQSPLDCDHGAAGDDEEGGHLPVSLCLLESCCGSVGKEEDSMMGWTLHLVTLSKVGEGEDLPRGIFRVNVPPGVQQPTEKKMSTMNAGVRLGPSIPLRPSIGPATFETSSKPL